MERTISDETWRTLAHALNVDVAALRAIAAVESAGDGFLPPPSDRPKVLFEGHAFHRLTRGRFSADHPTLSFPTWTKKHYAKTGAGEWQRLEQACALDQAAAFQSASWGAFQIMGFNYALCGFSDVESFVAHQCAGAAAQLESFAHFISRKVFLTALRSQDWASFAAAYNGPGYAANQYDKKIAAAFAAHNRGPVSRGGSVMASSRNARLLSSGGRPEFAMAPARLRPPRRSSTAAAPEMRIEDRSSRGRRRG